MKHFLLIFLLLCILCTVNCSHVLEQKIFPQEYHLSSVRYPLAEPQIRDMDIKNGFLILNMNSSTIIIYSTTDYSYISYFGGRRTDRSAFNQFLKSSSPFLYIMNVNNKNEIKKYEIDSLGTPVIFQTSFTGISNAMNRPYIVNDSLILYDEFIPEASIKIHNLYTNSKERALSYGTTSLEDRFVDKNMGGLYANDSCIAFVYKYQDRIDFHDWEFNLKQSVNHQISDPVIIQPTWTNNRPPKNILYYGKAYMGQNYFYALYRGVSHKDFHRDSLPNVSGFGYTYGIKHDVLEVYELDGQPVCRFRFDDVSPSVFVVDEAQNRLLGYREVYSDSLLVYQMQGLPKNGKKTKPVTQSYLSSLPTTPEPERPKAYIDAGVSGRPDVAPIYFVYMEQLGYYPTSEILKK